jgi:carbon storage regulator
MLINSRRVGERICIGEGIEVVVTEVTRKGVRLGINAPSETVILRGEVRDSIEQANRAAASSDLQVDPGAEVAPGEPKEGRVPGVLSPLSPKR